MIGLRLAVLISALVPLSAAANADNLACISTTFRLLSPNDKVCVSAFDDPKVPGVACHISQARTGGWTGSVGLAEDPSRFSIACRQIGPISADRSKLENSEKVYSEKTSIFSSTRKFSAPSIKRAIPSSTLPLATS
jgi:CreA protein